MILNIAMENQIFWVFEEKKWKIFSLSSAMDSAWRELISIIGGFLPTG